MTHDQSKALLDDLAVFGVPVVLFSGGEPLLRPDTLSLVEYAVSLGMRAVLSTNGTLLNDEASGRLKRAGLSYAGISLDGLPELHDAFRGKAGAFDGAMAGIEACRKAGIKVGLRLTLTQRNFRQVPDIFKLLQEKAIPRICFYHLVYAGRGESLRKDALSKSESRQVVDRIIDETAALHKKNIPTEVLTVDNHADGPYLYLRLLREDPERAKRVLELLRMNGGNSTGHGIGCVSWDGSVHADQFWRHHSFGNVLQKPFSQIWTDGSDSLLSKLKDKKKYVKGRCATCRFLDICGGNCRVRAEAVYGDIWAEEPDCYLTDQEISGEAK